MRLVAAAIVLAIGCGKESTTQRPPTVKELGQRCEKQLHVPLRDMKRGDIVKACAPLFEPSCSAAMMATEVKTDADFARVMRACRDAYRRIDRSLDAVAKVR